MSVSILIGDVRERLPAVVEIGMEIPARTPREEISEIIRAAAERGKVTVADILSPRRPANVVKARWEVMGALHALKRADGSPRHSLKRIGQILGRHHGSVIHGLRQLEAARQGNAA